VVEAGGGLGGGLSRGSAGPACAGTAGAGCGGAGLPVTAPESAEPMEAIWADFERIVPDGMTHWQHPRFFAYFPANAAPASMLAEQLVNAMACNALIWQTSPAATEVEQVMMGWLRQALGLPEDFAGTIHDSATSATLSAVLTMREKALDWAGLTKGLAGAPVLRFYASAETHSSVDKAIRVAGIGQANLVKVETDSDRAMTGAALRAAIVADRAAGISTGGGDPVRRGAPVSGPSTGSGSVSRWPMPRGCRCMSMRPGRDRR
jgi:aromatic-L-amino-acid decarboxylase